MSLYGQMTNWLAACGWAVFLFCCSILAVEAVIVIACLILGMILDIRHFQIIYLLGLILYHLITFVMAAKFFWIQYLLGMAISCALVLLKWTSLLSWLLAAGTVVLTVPLLGPIHYMGLPILGCVTAFGVALSMWQLTPIYSETSVANPTQDKSANPTVKSA